MYKKMILKAGLLGVLISMSGSLFAASALQKALETAIAQSQESQICCLPVLETVKGGKQLSYCYFADKDGYVAARIDDDNVRDRVDANWQEYPVCQDKWCTFSRGTARDKRYYRTNKQGRILQENDKKFAQDHVGFLKDQEGQQVAAGGLAWIGAKEPDQCVIGKNFNVELLSPLCAMKSEGGKNLSYPSDPKDVIRALVNGDYESYVLFYIEKSINQVTGVLDKKYIPSFMESDFNVKLNVCPENDSNGAVFYRLGYQIPAQ